MSAPPAVPTPLHGLRTWSAIGEAGRERLAGPQRGTPWPPGGAWLEARCEHGHAAPAPGCDCGIHAWHAGPRGARQILSAPGEIPGVVVAEGAIELDETRFRAQRGRPYALLITPHGNTGLIRRLADAYGAEAVAVAGADEVVAWCRARGLGLAPPDVERILGPDALAALRRNRQRRRRAAALRVAAAAAVLAALVGAGVAATDRPGDRTLNGRTGEVRPP